MQSAAETPADAGVAGEVQWLGRLGLGRLGLGRLGLGRLGLGPAGFSRSGDAPGDVPSWATDQGIRGESWAGWAGRRDAGPGGLGCGVLGRVS